MILNRDLGFDPDALTAGVRNAGLVDPLPFTVSLIPTLDLVLVEFFVSLMEPTFRFEHQWPKMKIL